MKKARIITISNKGRRTVLLFKNETELMVFTNENFIKKTGKMMLNPKFTNIEVWFGTEHDEAILHIKYGDKEEQDIVTDNVMLLLGIMYHSDLAERDDVSMELEG